jgi:hypothetical protein
LSKGKESCTPSKSLFNLKKYYFLKSKNYDKRIKLKIKGSCRNRSPLPKLTAYEKI